MKSGIYKKIRSIFTGKHALYAFIVLACTLITTGIAIYLFVQQRTSENSSRTSDNLNRRNVLVEVQGARDRLHGVLVCRQIPWFCSDSAALRYTDRISTLFVDNPSLVMKLQKLYVSLAVGKTHADKLRQILESKEAHLSDTGSLENAIHGVVAEADRVGPLLAEEVGGTWKVPPKNLTNEHLANYLIIEYKEVSGTISAEHTTGLFGQ